MVKIRKLIFSYWLTAVLSVAALAGAKADIFVVTSADDDGPGTLRQAILSANANPGPDTIAFNLDPSVSLTISLLSPLPDVTDTLAIEGASQPGYQGTPIVEIEGSGFDPSN